MFRHRCAKFKCKKCGHIQSLGEDTIYATEKMACKICKNKFPKKDLETFRELWDALRRVESFDVDIYTSTEISSLQISLKARTGADDAVKTRCEILNCQQPSRAQALENADLSEHYCIGAIVGAIKEYHTELRSALKEQGVSISGFIEEPIYPSDGIVD